MSSFTAPCYPLNLLLHHSIRSKQKRWATALADRLQPLLPVGCYCHAAGWMPGCEPLIEFKELEWIDVYIEPGPGMRASHRFTYPDAPTDGQVARICEELVERWR